MADDIILKVDDVTKMFGGLAALKDVEFSVPSGEIKAVIGPNGAGKTTLFDVLTGVQRPTSGRVFLKEDRHNAHEATPYHRAGDGADVPDNKAVRGHDSPRERNGRMSLLDEVWLHFERAAATVGAS